MLRWHDVDPEKKLIRFSTARAGRSYNIPMPERSAPILKDWREQAPPSVWVFPSPRNPEQPFGEQVRDDNCDVASAHHLRYKMRKRRADLGTTLCLARLALGYKLTQYVSQCYVAGSLLVEALRPLLNAVAERHAEELAW